MKVFDKNNPDYTQQYEKIAWLCTSDAYKQKLSDGFDQIMQNTAWSKAMKKSEAFGVDC